MKGAILIEREPSWAPILSRAGPLIFNAPTKAVHDMHAKLLQRKFSPFFFFC